MNLNEINFSFNGKHCLRDFGCIYAEKEGHMMTPKIKRNSYTIEGMDGTLLLDGQTLANMTFEGNLYMLKTLPSQQDAQRALRRMTAWLTAGRGQLIFDYEPSKYYMAEVVDQLKWSFKDWIDGGLVIKFQAQPMAYAVWETAVKKVITNFGDSLNLVMDTGLDTPIRINLHNGGTAPITGVTVTVGSKVVKLAGMSCKTSLEINMEPPIGALFLDGSNALPYASRFDQLTASVGSNTIKIALTFGSGTRSVIAAASARGRWI